MHHCIHCVSMGTLHFVYLLLFIVPCSKYTVKAMHVAGIRNSLNSVSLSHVRASAHAEAGRGRQGQPAAPMHLDVPFSLSSVGSALLPKLCFFSLNAVASRVWGFSGVGTSWRGCKVRRLQGCRLVYGQQSVWMCMLR
mmetsp:Transcript_255/g.583  ORF Transcript_255/g.583 Transcript_255/m.583 type:complete len:138 (+) Transcript_255:1003-1416(+)